MAILPMRLSPASRKPPGRSEFEVQTIATYSRLPWRSHRVGADFAPETRQHRHVAFSSRFQDQSLLQARSTGCLAPVSRHILYKIKPEATLRSGNLRRPYVGGMLGADFSNAMAYYSKCQKFCPNYPENPLFEKSRFSGPFRQKLLSYSEITLMLFRTLPVAPGCNKVPEEEKTSGNHYIDPEIARLRELPVVGPYHCNALLTFSREPRNSAS
jgi:hypothetical protein